MLVRHIKIYLRILFRNSLFNLNAAEVLSFSVLRNFIEGLFDNKYFTTIGKTTMIAQLLLQSRQKNIENQFRHFVHQNPKTSVTSIYNTFLNSHYTSPTIHTQQVHPFYLNTSLHNFTFFDTPGWRRIIKAYRICAQVSTKYYYNIFYVL
jgi:hypothetical protein